ncbi:tetratricopeptide repeat protein [Corynebacterium sp.]|uniref:tetratricopeptide repeat protein n=1 Tax=Corynebacterium sp. TaxID=1720 RepID=UPI0028A9F13A|nr:tetratricopeptide repeat protein [Corynebacterium sp.]
MTASIVQWGSDIAELSERFDSLEREEVVTQMRELAEACPATDGRAVFELAGLYDSTGYEAEAEAEAGTAYERALELGLDAARHARLAVQYGSTLRSLGKVALALHSAGRKDEALRVAIEAQIDNLPRYQRSMRDYAKPLS